MYTELKTTIESAWDNKGLLAEEQTQKSIREVIELLDKGQLRVAEKIDNVWKVNEWVKK
ncbi:MAG: 2,3,4,5-tetrahydropyridine-2,6-dicarboxylate N-succinyltransferase, partial [Bacteroidales bacterium]|nr:2,3,4,5-tetrahydropyridine-2,6-dicarboxylate N-succinyltransferase [Bacteroidales bacterium]